MRIQRLSEITEFPNLRPMSPQEVAEALALAKAVFTADDLQRYTEELDGVPMEDTLREMEEIQRCAKQGNS